MPSSNIGVKVFSNKGTMLSWAKPSCLKAIPLNSTTMASYTSSRVIISKRLWFIELETLQGTLFCREVLHLFVGAGDVVTIGDAESSIHTSWCSLLNGGLTYPSISRKIGVYKSILFEFHLVLSKGLRVLKTYSISSWICI
jgi:hypothetical protein